MYPRWLWPTFAAPGVIWLILLFLVPFYAVIGVAFGSVDPILGFAVPAWNPIELERRLAVEVLGELAPGGIYFDVACARSSTWLIALAGCALIGYPVAYYIARHAGRTKTLLLILLILPFWISYLMRMLAWVNLLAPDGYVNRFLIWAHVAERPRTACSTASRRPSSGADLRLHPVLHPAAARPRSTASTGATWRRRATSAPARSALSCTSRCRCRRPACWAAPC